MKYHPGEEYVGKIRVVKRGKTVLASLWETRKNGETTLEKEVIGEIPKAYFPEGTKQKPGQIFKYYTGYRLEMVPERVVSPEEMERMKKDLDRKMRGLPDEYT